MNCNAGLGLRVGRSPDYARGFGQRSFAPGPGRALVLTAGLIVHSDQGSQYRATRFKELLTRPSAQQSMSRRGNCYNNAHAESFWSRFKAELLDGGRFSGLEEVRFEISHHVAYYNVERRYSAFGCQSPNHFETQIKTTSQLFPA